MSGGVEGCDPIAISSLNRWGLSKVTIGNSFVALPLRWNNRDECFCWADDGFGPFRESGVGSMEFVNNEHSYGR